MKEKKDSNRLTYEEIKAVLEEELENYLSEHEDEVMELEFNGFYSEDN